MEGYPEDGVVHVKVKDERNVAEKKTSRSAVSCPGDVGIRAVHGQDMPRKFANLQ